MIVEIDSDDIDDYQQKLLDAYHDLALMRMAGKKLLQILDNEDYRPDDEEANEYYAAKKVIEG